MNLYRLIIIYLLILWFIPEPLYAKDITLSAMEYPPYYGAELINKGFISEIITTALERKGYNVKIIVLPWVRAFEKTKNGDYDGIITLLHRKEREKWFYYTDPLPPLQISFMKRKEFSDPKACTVKALKNYTIGVVRGYVNTPEFDAIMDKLKIEKVTVDSQNIKKLASKRIDLMITDLNVANYIIQKKYPELEGKIIPVNNLLFKQDNHYLGISKKNSDAEKIVEDYNSSLKKMNLDGTLQAILKKHQVDKNYNTMFE